MWLALADLEFACKRFTPTIIRELDDAAHFSTSAGSMAGISAGVGAQPEALTREGGGQSLAIAAATAW